MKETMTVWRGRTNHFQNPEVTWQFGEKMQEQRRNIGRPGPAAKSQTSPTMRSSSLTLVEFPWALDGSSSSQWKKDAIGGIQEEPKLRNGYG